MYIRCKIVLGDIMLTQKSLRRYHAYWKDLICCLGSLAMSRRIRLFRLVEATDVGSSPGRNSTELSMRSSALCSNVLDEGSSGPCEGRISIDFVYNNPSPEDIRSCSRERR